MAHERICVLRRCNAKIYVQKGKGRPVITEVMFNSGYPSGSNSSLDTIARHSKKISAHNPFSTFKPKIC
jgi:hypothetical protein